jgi:hypothetical protein
VSDTAVLRDTRNVTEARPGTGPSGRFGERDTLSANEVGADTDEDILFEARHRFKRINDWEGTFRTQFVDDVRFANGDSDNHWQWPDEMFSDRDAAQRPSLTVNKTRQHCLQVVNDAKQNKPQIRITPVSDEATKASADVYEGVMRHIEYISSASVAYDTATEHQVQGGIGWWRINTEPEDPGGFDLGCRIQRVRDALSVWADPDIQEVDGSDMRFAFVVDDVPRDDFEAKYPEYRDRVPQASFAGPVIVGGWLDEDHVRVAEYFRKSEREDVLHLLPDGTTVRESELTEDGSLRDLRRISLRSRRLKDDRVEWFKIVGGEIVDRDVWPGKYIPLVRVIGEEAVIDGRLERKGHVRALKDPQRIYNYWTSSGVEAVALQSKSPYIAAAESIEAFQKYWDTANTVNHSVLPFNARDDQGQQLPPPTRQDPPQMPQAYIQGMQIAQQEMMMASGQYQPSMGQPDPNQTSGKAIALRQRQGDTATYHFIDNLAIAIRFTGRILLDLIPKVYDTPRVLRILAMDGSVGRVQLDPNQPQALQQIQNPDPQAPQQASAGPLPPTPQQALTAMVTRIFNPQVGRYEVQADVGPNYATKRQQAYDAFVQIVATAPQIMQVAGDLLFKAADFPMAEELAERLQRLVPPQAMGQGPSPAEQQLQQQLQAAQAHIALLSEKLSVETLKVKSRDEGHDLEGYKAVTTRLGTLLNAADTDSPYVAPEEVRLMIRDLIMDVMATTNIVGAVNQANMAALAPAPPQMPPNGLQGPPLMSGAPPPMAPGAPPGTPPGLHPGVFSGMHAALSPVRPPVIRPPGQPPPLLSVPGGRP